MTIAEINNQQDLVDSAKKETNLNIQGLSQITLRFGIQQKVDRFFEGKIIVSLTS